MQSSWNRVIILGWWLTNLELKLCCCIIAKRCLNSNSKVRNHFLLKLIPTTPLWCHPKPYIIRSGSYWSPPKGGWEKEVVSGGFVRFCQDIQIEGETQQIVIVLPIVTQEAIAWRGMELAKQKVGAEKSNPTWVTSVGEFWCKIFLYILKSERGGR